MRTTLIVFICFLVSAGLGCIAFFSGQLTYNDFASGSILEIIGTIFAINIGIVSFLHYGLTKLERELKLERDFFTHSKKEIKQNVIVMTILLLVATIFSALIELIQVDIVDYVLSTLIIFFFFITAVMLNDSVQGILILDKVITNE